MACLQSMPNEVLIDIAVSLPSLEDVLSFSTACRLTRQLWLDNARLITRAVGEQSTVSWKEAEALALDECGGAPNISRTIAHILLRNLRSAGRCIDFFNRRLILEDMRVHRHICEKTWGTTTRPPHLTRTERYRFSRTLYQAWRLMVRARDGGPVNQAFHELLDALPLRHVSRLNELFACFDQTANLPSFLRWEDHDYAILRAVQERQSDLYWSYYGRQPLVPLPTPGDELGFVSMCSVYDFFPVWERDYLGMIGPLVPPRPNDAQVRRHVLGDDVEWEPVLVRNWRELKAQPVRKYSVE